MLSPCYATILHFITAFVCDVVIQSSVSVYRQYNFFKGFVQERSGNSSAKKGKRIRFIQLTLRLSASMWSVLGLETSQGSLYNELVTQTL